MNKSFSKLNFFTLTSGQKYSGDQVVPVRHLASEAAVTWLEMEKDVSGLLKSSCQERGQRKYSGGNEEEYKELNRKEISGTLVVFTYGVNCI